MLKKLVPIFMAVWISAVLFLRYRMDPEIVYVAGGLFGVMMLRGLMDARSSKNAEIELEELNRLNQH